MCQFSDPLAVGLGRGTIDLTQVAATLVAAFADARQKMEALTSDEMSKTTGGLQLPPGFKMPGFS